MTKRSGSVESGTGALARSPINLGASRHDEWLIDEALEESFPASDAPLPSRPGSTASRRSALTAEQVDDASAAIRDRQ